MENIKGKKIKITLFKLEDALQMRKWGSHDNPLFSDYNFPLEDYSEIREWYNAKIFGINKKYYSVYNEENKFIGYLGIKNIRKILKEATLGIVFDPNYINKGYGTETLRTFLDYYFNVLGMRSLLLEVAKFNKRAMRVYKKNGFKIVDKYLEKYYDQFIDLNNPYFLEEKSSFVIKHGKIYNYIYKMKIDKDTFKKMEEINE